MSTSGGNRVFTVGPHAINAAQLATLHTTPITLVAAPGLGRIIAVQDIIEEWVPGTSGYTGTDAGELSYTNDAANFGIFITSPLVDLSSTAPSIAYTSVGYVDQAQQPWTPSDIANLPIVVTAGTDGARQAPIATSTLHDAGIGYAANDTGTVAALNFGTAATYKVLTVGALGVVLTYQLTTAGTKYDLTHNPVSTTAGGSQPGVGTGFTVDIASLAPADGILYVTLQYQIITTH